jgi:hypothetical protein
MRGVETGRTAFAIVFTLVAWSRGAEAARAETQHREVFDRYTMAQATGNAVDFVSDVTIPDGMVVNPGQSFTKN